LTTKGNRVVTEEELEGISHVTEEELEGISHQSENSPRKSLRRLAKQSVLSVGSMWAATKLLHICPHKIIVVNEIMPMDYGKE
jgi:hypothetical protein